MEIILIRHFESKKNIQKSFSLDLATEKLTEKGRILCKKFGYLFCDLCSKHKLTINQINCTDSLRAKETASIIASCFNNVPITCHEELKSTNVGTLSGKTLEEVKHIDSFFSKNFYLYQKDLLNSYFFDENWQNEKKETKKEFEKRVIKCFLKILENSYSTVVIVGHKAPITAILIYVARLLNIYSNSFYGHINLDLGRLSWLSFENNSWDIKFVNEEIENILQV